MNRIAAAFAVLVCGAAHGAEGWRLQLTGCGGVEAVHYPTLSQALELELGPPGVPARFAVQVRWPCGADAVARVGVEDGGGEFESFVDLATTPAELWPRVISLVARQLVHDAGTAAPPPAFTFSGPDGAAPAGHEWVARVAFDTRVYPLQPTAVLSAAVEGGWRWFRIAVVTGWTEAGDETAQIEVGTALAQLGAVPFRWKSGTWELGAGAFVEGGVAQASRQSYLAGLPGSTRTEPLAGGSLRGELAARVFSWFAITLSIDLGYETGMRVSSFNGPLVDLSGFFMQARLGIGL